MSNLKRVAEKLDLRPATILEFIKENGWIKRMGQNKQILKIDHDLTQKLRPHMDELRKLNKKYVMTDAEWDQNVKDAQEEVATRQSKERSSVRIIYTPTGGRDR